MTRFGIVGTGWRSMFYLRIAHACADRFTVTGIVTRDPQRAADAIRPFDLPFFTSSADLISETSPDFVVTSVPWNVNPGAIKELADLGMPVLSETPPATTVDEMVELWRLTQSGAKIQVAEQFWVQPHHAARIAFAHGGKLGRVSQAQVSVCHGYHGTSLIRRYLGVGFENAAITAKAVASPIVAGPGRGGPPDEETVAESKQTIAHLDFGDRFGVFDFTGDQYFSYIRGQRVCVRGERGEIIDSSAVYLRDHRTPVRVAFTRHEAGQNGNLEGSYLKGIQAGEEWVYENPLAPGRLSDEEIAIGTCLLGMGDYAAGGEPVYSLAEACQDRYLNICIDQAAESGDAVQTETQPWAE